MATRAAAVSAATARRAARRGRQGVGQVFRLTFAAHARVDVDLLVPCGDVGGNHRFGFRQRVLSRQVTPRIRAKVIATEDYPFTREPHLISNTVYLVAEGGGGHARVTTLLVDLVTRRFDEHRRSMSGRFAQGCFDDHRMRRAHRGDAR